MTTNGRMATQRIGVFPIRSSPLPNSLTYVPAFTCATACRHQLVHLDAELLSVTATPLAVISPQHLVKHVAVAGFLEIGGDHFLGIGGGGVAGNAELFGDQLPEQFVAARLGLELLLLVEGEFLLKTFLALVESGHFCGSNPGKW